MKPLVPGLPAFSSLERTVWQKKHNRRINTNPLVELTFPSSSRSDTVLFKKYRISPTGFPVTSLTRWDLFFDLLVIRVFIWRFLWYKAQQRLAITSCMLFSHFSVNTDRQFNTEFVIPEKRNMVYIYINILIMFYLFGRFFKTYLISIKLSSRK